MSTRVDARLKVNPSLGSCWLGIANGPPEPPPCDSENTGGEPYGYDGKGVNVYVGDESLEENPFAELLLQGRPFRIYQPSVGEQDREYQQQGRQYGGRDQG